MLKYLNKYKIDFCHNLLLCPKIYSNLNLHRFTSNSYANYFLRVFFSSTKILLNIIHQLITLRLTQTFMSVFIRYFFLKRKWNFCVNWESNIYYITSQFIPARNVIWQFRASIRDVWRVYACKRYWIACFSCRNKDTEISVDCRTRTYNGVTYDVRVDNFFGTSDRHIWQRIHCSV